MRYTHDFGSAFGALHQQQVSDEGADVYFTVPDPAPDHSLGRLNVAVDPDGANPATWRLALKDASGAVVWSGMTTADGSGGVQFKSPDWTRRHDVGVKPGRYTFSMDLVPGSYDILRGPQHGVLIEFHPLDTKGDNGKSVDVASHDLHPGTGNKGAAKKAG